MRAPKTGAVQTVGRNPAQLLLRLNRLDVAVMLAESGGILSQHRGDYQIHFISIMQNDLLHVEMLNKIMVDYFIQS